MYRVELSPEAESIYRRLEKLEPALWRRLDAALNFIAEIPFAGKKLKGELQGRRSYRVGSYRIIYRVFQEKLFVYVLDIGHRREIYR